jgi:hypothetical protein
MVAISSLPTVLALIAHPAGLTGFGTIMFVNDFAQYEAAMGEAARSTSWLVHDHLTSEAHSAAFMFLLYVAIGKIGALFGTGWEPVYRVVELLARGVLATALAAFTLRFSAPGWQKMGIVLALGGAGIGLWAAIAQALVGVAQPYSGNASYEVNTYSLFFGVPHAELGMTATLGAFWILAEASMQWNRNRAALLAGCVLILGLVHPFNLVTLVGGVSLLTVLDWRNGAPLPQRIAPLAIVLTLAAPFLAYNALTFTLDPFWGATYGAQNLLPSPAPWELPVDLGVFLLGIAGLSRARRASPAAARLAALGMLALVAMYAPVPFQRRLGFGLMPLLAVLTTYTLAWIATAQPRWRGLATALTLVAALSTPLFFFGGMIASALTNGPIAVYRAPDDLAAARSWLAANTGPSDVVLGSWDTMNYLAGAIPGRTAGGHPVATLATGERHREADSLFQSPEAQLTAILHEHARYLVVSGAAEPVFATQFTLAFVTGPPSNVRAVPIHPAASPQASTVFTSGAVQVVRLGPA